MKRIRKLGLATMVAIAALAVLGAASASATTGFAAEVAPAETATIAAEYTEGLLFTVNGHAVECGKPALGSPTTIKGGANVAPISVAQEVVKRTCTSGFGEAYFEQKGCSFTFTPDGSTLATLGIEGCGAMVLTSEGCARELQPQSVTVATANEGSPVAVSVTAKSVTLKFKSSGCGEGSLTLKTKWRLKALNNLSEQAGLYSTGKNGVFFNAGAKLFEAELYPESLSGESVGKHLIEVEGGTNQPAECEAGFSSMTALSNASSSISVAAGYGNCWRTVLFVKRYVTINMNSCYYTLSASGTVAVACGKEGDKIEVNMWNTSKEEEVNLACRRAIAPQTVGTVSYETVGSGFDRALSANLNLSGINSTLLFTNGKLCNPNEVVTTGTYKGTLTLH